MGLPMVLREILFTIIKVSQTLQVSGFGQNYSGRSVPPPNTCLVPPPLKCCVITHVYTLPTWHADPCTLRWAVLRLNLDPQQFCAHIALMACSLLISSVII